MKKTMIQISKTLKMQKYFIIVAVTMLSLVSCTKLEDMAPPRPITFSTAIYKPQTKAEVSIMNEFTNFSCKAFLHAAGYEDETQDFFKTANTIGETIYAYDGNNSVVTSGTVAYWAPSHDYYWPKAASSYINFIGWWDKRGVAPETSTETSLSWTNYTVATDDNLLFADEAWRYNGNPNSIYHKEGEGESYKAVPMLFHHALAKVCFKAAVTKTSQANATGSDNGSTTWDVTLSNISLAGVYNTGTLALTNSDPNSATTRAWTGSWDVTDQTPTTLNMRDVTSALTTSVDRDTILAMQSVLPQSVTNSMILTLTYNIVTKYSGVEYAHEKIQTSIDLSTISGASGPITSWDMNKKITYTIVINPETTLVRIDPAMVDWVTDSGSYPNNN